MSALSVFAAEIADAAGRIARRRFYSARRRVGAKEDGSPVTETDREVEELISGLVAEKYPRHGFLGEETGARGDRGNCWVVDPIDGTTNFIHQYDRCAVSVAFCQDGRAVAGAVHDITANETFSAAAGEGAYLHNRRMRITPGGELGDALFIASGVLDGNMWALIRELSRRTAGMRRSGSTALDLAAVAAGRADVIVCGRVRYWDVAAGALLLREAGGLLADSGGGTAFDFAGPTRCFAAGAPGVFAPCFSALKKHCA